MTQIILAGRPIDPEEYDPTRKTVWDMGIQETGIVPPTYSGSIERPCSDCGIRVQIGPRQQAALPAGLEDPWSRIWIDAMQGVQGLILLEDQEVLILCLICAALNPDVGPLPSLVAGNLGVTERVAEANLNNPETNKE